MTDEALIRKLLLEASKRNLDMVDLSAFVVTSMLQSGWLPPDAAKAMRNEVLEECAKVIDENIIGYGAGEPSLRKRPQDDVQCLTYAAAIRAMKE